MVQNCQFPGQNGFIWSIRFQIGSNVLVLVEIDAFLCRVRQFRSKMGWKSANPRQNRPIWVKIGPFWLKWADSVETSVLELSTSTDRFFCTNWPIVDQLFHPKILTLVNWSFNRIRPFKPKWTNFEPNWSILSQIGRFSFQELSPSAKNGSISTQTSPFDPIWTE